MPALRNALAVFCMLLAAGFAGTSLAQDPGKPLLLVATPELDGAYRETALVVVPVGDKHLGFILNRATKATMGDLFPDHEPSAKVVDPVYFGGPEATNAVFAAVRSNPGTPALKLSEDLYITGNGRNVDRIIEQRPNEARYFVGFVGWQAGELEEEIARGYWYPAALDAALVFRKDTSGLWEEQVKRLGGSTLRPRKGQLVSSAAAP